MDYAIKIQVTVYARYTTDREAWTDAESIARHIEAESGDIVDAVDVVSVEATGDSREE